MSLDLNEQSKYMTVNLLLYRPSLLIWYLQHLQLSFESLQDEKLTYQFSAVYEHCQRIKMFVYKNS